ncbi:MAG: hypothetical protein SVV67_01700 [Bacillota bacterium]|nr:hypothetical protein [Bacillota bacterium]
MQVLLVFIDGIGLGKQQPDNPFVFTETSSIEHLLAGRKLLEGSRGYCGPKASLLGLDATLGVPGLPQSATGQASLFTGVNAAKMMGQHMSGFPDQSIRQLLARKGIFLQLHNHGYRTNFANAYRPPFFDYLQRGLPGNFYSCSTLITYYGGLDFHDLEDIKKGRALFMDITNNALKQLGFEVPYITPEEGAARLIKIAGQYHFCLFEYFLSDLAGHKKDRMEAERVVGMLDRFIGALANEIETNHTLLIVTSDHGNLEDLSSGAHTLNDVPAILIGSYQVRQWLAKNIFNLTDVLPAILNILSNHNQKEASANA